MDEQGFTAEQEDDGLDKDTIHLLALSDDGMPIGTLRFFPPPKGKIGRLGAFLEQLNFAEPVHTVLMIPHILTKQPFSHARVELGRARLWFKL